MRTSTAAWAAALAVMSMRGPFTTAEAAPARQAEYERPKHLFAKPIRRAYNGTDPLVESTQSESSDTTTSTPEFTPDASPSQPIPESSPSTGTTRSRSSSGSEPTYDHSSVIDSLINAGVLPETTDGVVTTKIERPGPTGTETYTITYTETSSRPSDARSTASLTTSTSIPTSPSSDQSSPSSLQNGLPNAPTPSGGLSPLAQPTGQLPSNPLQPTGVVPSNPTSTDSAKTVDTAAPRIPSEQPQRATFAHNTVQPFSGNNTADSQPQGTGQTDPIPTSSGDQPASAATTEPDSPAPAFGSLGSQLSQVIPQTAHQDGGNSSPSAAPTDSPALGTGGGIIPSVLPTPKIRPGSQGQRPPYQQSSFAVPSNHPFGTGRPLLGTGGLAGLGQGLPTPTPDALRPNARPNAVRPDIINGGSQILPTADGPTLVGVSTALTPGSDGTGPSNSNPTDTLLSELTGALPTPKPTDGSSGNSSDGIVPDVVPAVTSDVGSGLGGVASVLPTGTGGLPDGFATVTGLSGATEVVPTITSALGSGLSQVTGTVGVVGQATSDVNSIVSSVQSEAGSAVSDLGDSTDVVPALVTPSLQSSLDSKLSSIVATVTDPAVAASLSTAFSSILTSAASTINSVASAATDPVNSVVSTVDSAGNSIASTVNSVVSTVDSAGNSIASTVNSVVSTVNSIASTATGTNIPIPTTPLTVTAGGDTVTLTPTSPLSGVTGTGSGATLPATTGTGTTTTPATTEQPTTSTGTASPTDTKATAGSTLTTSVPSNTGATVSTASDTQTPSPTSPTSTTVTPHVLTASAPHSIQPTGTDSDTKMTLPTVWTFAPTSTESTKTPDGIAIATSTTPSSSTGLPTYMPRLVQPPGGMPEPPANSTLIQVGFNFGLNFPFVVSQQESASQIFAYLPQGVAYGLGISADQVVMNALMPYDTSASLHYITTLAQAYVPSDQVSQMQLDLHTSTSAMYQNPDSPVRTLMNMINPTISILPGAALDGLSASSGYNPAATGVSAASDGAPIGGDSGNSKSVKGTSVSIGIGAVAGAAVYAAAMIYVARRYRQKRKGHQRASSVPTAGEMRQTSSGGMGGFFMSGANGRNSRGSTSHSGGGRVSRTSNGSSNGRSVREQGISAPVMSENSLGWN